MRALRRAVFQSTGKPALEVKTPSGFFPEGHEPRAHCRFQAGARRCASLRVTYHTGTMRALSGPLEDAHWQAAPEPFNHHP